MAQLIRKQLALAVKKIQWSYAIFWSISSTQNGALEWDDGYYNGDIKTRKTVQAEQLNADELGLQRTEQLRELYESLLDAENNPQLERPSAALSPEDLTDTEWYFLICMSFVFNIGQGLPGRSLAKKQTIWLCNANNADSKVFNRTLLAKSASIQTVICFPYSDGVIELGTTELVTEDPSIVQHITSFLETPGIVVSNQLKYVFETSRHGNDTKCAQLDQKVVDANHPENELEKGNTFSTNGSSEEYEPNYPEKESLMADHINDGTSQLQSWQIMDEEISNVVNSGGSSDCISQTLIGPGKFVPRQDEVNEVNEDHLLSLQDSKDMELTSAEIQKDDIHYQGIVSTLLKTSHQLVMGPCLKSSIEDSCFIRWKKGRSPVKHKSGGASQRLLKKVLYEVSLMHSDGEIRRAETQELDANHAPEERRQREKMHEKFMILRSIIPSTGKVDNVSLLDDTIEYLRNLEEKVEGLESQKELGDAEARRRKRSCNVIESTSGNYDDKKVSNCKKQVLRKRGFGSINMNAVTQFYQEDNMTDDVKVSKTENGIVIEIKCPWREELFAVIMGAISNLHLDCHSVQSSNIDGNLTLTITSKVKGSTIPSVKVIRQALQRVTRKS